MKRQIAIALIITGLAVAGVTQVYAGWGRGGQGGGPGMGYGGYCGACPQYQGGPAAQVDPARQEKLDAFFADTQDLRREIAVKQAERQALMRADNPDPAALAQVAGELYDLRTAMREKADEAGITAFAGPRGGAGFGPGRGGPGRGGCGAGGFGAGNCKMSGPGFGGPRS